MSGNRKEWLPRVVGFLVVAGMMAVMVTGWSQQKQSRKKTAKSDSLATVTSDSIVTMGTDLGMINDSLRIADSIAQWRDSVKITSLRKVRNVAFGVGERLVFDVNYGFITAGEAVMSVVRLDSVAGRQCYRVEFTVNSLPSFDWIYTVRDRYLTFIDTETIAPWRFEQHIREGSYRRDFVAEFDQYRLVARTTEGDHDIPEYVHDIMSAFYYARTLDFSGYNVGDGPLLYNFFRKKSHELKIRFLGRQELEIEAGTFKTIVLEPIVKEGGLFKSEGRIVIWLTDDDRKIPVRVNTKVLVGSIDTELREYSGILGPTTARIR
ncbi:MAG: DUF3108 domain-containing protein [Ignavibacteria bacterium]|nr:DUF3108 domain-containing protein [Ignavibacteria bacterium]